MSDYARYTKSSKCLGGTSTFLCRAPIILQSMMQEIVDILVTQSSYCSDMPCTGHDECQATFSVDII